MEQRGFHCAIVEKWNPYVGKFGIRQDMFGIVDVVCIAPEKIIGIQSCGNSFSSHYQKILKNEMAPEWIKAGAGLELWAWRKVKLKRGAKAMRWQPRIHVFRLEDFE